MLNAMRSQHALIEIKKGDWPMTICSLQVMMDHKNITTTEKYFEVLAARSAPRRDQILGVRRLRLGHQRLTKSLVSDCNIRLHFKPFLAVERRLGTDPSSEGMTDRKGKSECKGKKRILCFGPDDKTCFNCGLRGRSGCRAWGGG